MDIRKVKKLILDVFNFLRISKGENMDFTRVDKLFGSPIKKFKKMEEEKGKMNISN